MARGYPCSQAWNRPASPRSAEPAGCGRRRSSRSSRRWSSRARSSAPRTASGSATEPVSPGASPKSPRETGNGNAPSPAPSHCNRPREEEGGAGAPLHPTQRCPRLPPPDHRVPQAIADRDAASIRERAASHLEWPRAYYRTNTTSTPRDRQDRSSCNLLLDPSSTSFWTPVCGFAAGTTLESIRRGYIMVCWSLA